MVVGENKTVPWALKQYLGRKTLSFPLPIFGHYSNAFPQNQLWKLWILNLHHSATSHAIDTSHLLHLPGIMLWRNKLDKKLAFLHPFNNAGLIATGPTQGAFPFITKS